MRITVACLLIAAAPAWGQGPSAPPTSPYPQGSVVKKPAPAAKSNLNLNCADCGEIRSVRKVTKELKPEDSAPQQQGGLVASIPLGGGKAQVGSSTRVGDEAVRTATQWEVTLRYDDGRFRLLMLDKQPDFVEGDRVRVDSRGQLLAP